MPCFPQREQELQYRMSDDEASIISRLERLHIARRELIAEEERLLQELRTGENPQPPGAAGAAQGRERASGRVVGRGVVDRTGRRQDFQVGDHVFITNNIRHVPFRRRATPADRAAVIERTTDNRIYFHTYNGYSTWRHRDNLRFLTPREQTNIRDTYAQ